MSCWLTIPSARPPEEAEKVLKLWRERGYKIALYRDSGEWNPGCGADALLSPGEGRQYPGYAEAVNYLVELVSFHVDPTVEWFVIAGDDVQPDLNHSAEEIASQCAEYFGVRPDKAWHEGESISKRMHHPHLSTFGVMQPTGDRWQEGMGGFRNAPIDRVAGSAWYGREYCRRMYQGKGPLWHEYKHMFCDEEAQEVAIKMGVFWQRRDLTQLHMHVLRHPELGKLVDSRAIAEKAPHLVKWNTEKHWNESKKLFLDRKAAGFPGHEPL